MAGSVWTSKNIFLDVQSELLRSRNEEANDSLRLEKPFRGRVGSKESGGTSLLVRIRQEHGLEHPPSWVYVASLSEGSAFSLVA